MVFAKGTRFEVRCVEGGWQSDFASVLSLLVAGKRNSAGTQLATRFERLANGMQLRNPDYMETEGKLPNGKRFYAVKAGGAKIRAYFWYSNKHKGVIYISHFAYKKQRKLSTSDSNRVKRNWKSVEE